MEGVKILSTNTISNGNLTMLFPAFLSIALTLVLIIVITETIKNKDFIFSIFIAILLSLTFILSWMSLSIALDSTSHTEYKVTIDKTVGYIEFTNKYKVIDKDGDIYTIIENN